MSLLNDPEFMQYFERSKMAAKQQLNRMIDAMYAQMLHDFEYSTRALFLCQFCEQTFTSLGNCKLHQLVAHMNVKPYRCKACGYTSAQKDHVVGHIRVVHLGEYKENQVPVQPDTSGYLEKVSRLQSEHVSLQ